MTNRISYQVTASLPDEATAASYIEWLTGGHVQAVIDGGASSGEVVRLDQEAESGPIRVLTRYVFPSREAYDGYVEHTAPALRADGVQRFGGIEGVTFNRTLGEIL